MADSKAAQEAVKRSRILAGARALIGKKYSELDCSHMVHKAYESAELKYAYMSTEVLRLEVTNGSVFKRVEGDPKPGDLVLYPGHVGIYDPDGCADIATAECKKLDSDARILSARSGKNLGVEYGRSAWFGTPTCLRWNEFAD